MRRQLAQLPDRIKAVLFSTGSQSPPMSAADLPDHAANRRQTSGAVGCRVG